MKKTLAIILLFIFCLQAPLVSAAAANPAKAPVLKETTCLEKNGKISINFIFQSAKGEKYRIYRRGANTMKYTRLADVVATGKTYTYKDYKISTNHIYYYTVRRVYNNNKSLSQFDAVGIKGISFDTKPSIKLTTMQATIKFRTTPEASEYIVYRSLSGGAYKQLKRIPASTDAYIEYKDTYYKSLNSAQETKYFINNTYIDPTANPFRYEVRAVYRDEKKGYISRSLYYQNGACVIGTPAVSALKVTASGANIKWSGLPVAKSYNIYAKTSKAAPWEKLAVVKSKGANIEQATLKIKKKYTFYTVRAFAEAHGSLIASDYETDFYIGKRILAQKKALFIGDSLTTGKPYRGENITGFQFSKRVEQMLGIHCDNIAIPAATIADKTAVSNKYSILIDEVKQLYHGKYPRLPAEIPTPVSLSPMREYDYIVLQGGTNDYIANVKLGEPNSDDITTFNGAVNEIKHMLEQTNRIRKKAGLEELKVIILDIPYSLRCGSDYHTIRCRQTTPNARGLTAVDYSDAFVENMMHSDLNIRFLSCYEILNENNCLSDSADNLHFTKLGSGKMGKMIADTILYRF